MTSSIRQVTVLLVAIFVFGVVATRDPETDGGDFNSELSESHGLDAGMEKDLSEEEQNLPECECEGHEEGSVAGEVMCAYQDGTNCARLVDEDGAEKPCGEGGKLCRKKADSEDSHDEEHSKDAHEEEHSKDSHEDAQDISSETPTACEKSPATTKTVEIIFIVTGEADGPKVLTKKSQEGQAMNCGGSFYMQCGCDDFHPDKDEATGACYAPTPDGLPTEYAGEELDKGEANQLAYAAKKLFHTQTDPAQTIATLEKKKIKRMTLEGDGNKLYRVYPVPLKSSSQLDKTVESKEFQKLKCSEIVAAENPLNVKSHFRDLISQLRIKGCQ